MDTPMTEGFDTAKLPVDNVATKIINIMNDKDITSITIEGPWQKWDY